MRPRAFPERTLVMSTTTKISTPPTELYKEQGWNCNTELCVDVKTILHSERITKTGKDYRGVLTRDSEYHFIFREALPTTTFKRNPRVFIGKYITITRRKDGSLQPNFKPLKKGKDFSATAYAAGVANELLWALSGLLEKEASKA